MAVRKRGARQGAPTARRGSTKKKAGKGKAPTRRSPRAAPRGTKRAGAADEVMRAENYRHPEVAAAQPPDVGTQPHFRAKKPPRTWRYDSSLSPALDYDGQNAAREHGEWLLAMIEKASALPSPHRFSTPEVRTGADGRPVATVVSLADAVEQTRRLSQPFLNWAGKAERLSFDVPTLPLFVHERLSAKKIVDTLEGHRRADPARQLGMFDYFGDPRRPIGDQILKPYEHGAWVNRLILGDSLVVMNSLLEYEGLGGQVQMVYIDPPYGVKFGSNFQPFVRKRDVDHNDDDDMTREPEMVKAYRDTWELGLHSYLTYLRDRLLVARDLLHPSGSVFVQIDDENLHHVREALDEVYGRKNFVAVIPFVKTSALNSPDAKLSRPAANNDFIVWYARDIDRLKFRQVYRDKVAGIDDLGAFGFVELPDGTRRSLTKEEKSGRAPLPTGRLFAKADLTSQKPTTVYDFRYEGRTYNPLPRGWRTTEQGMRRLVELNRIFVAEASLRFVQYLDDFGVTPFGTFWDDTGTGSFTDDKIYVVQTANKAVERCMLMATDPGDLVLDPTCGSGTTAYVAERWGRRWITVDTSRVPLALARQRLLTSTFSWYRLKDGTRGPSGGFEYQRRQDRKGSEVGGIVPHVTLKTIANQEPPAEVVLVDRPEEDDGLVRVTGPFTVEATIATPVDWVGDGVEDSGDRHEHQSFLERMLEILRRAPTLQIGGGKSVTLGGVRAPARTLSLSGEAVADAKPVALLFGPENGAVSETQVYQAAREAAGKNYTHLYVIGFAIQPTALSFIATCDASMNIAATYIAATPDVMMGDLLKTTRASQIFSVCGLPDVEVHRVKAERGQAPKYEVELRGLDVFDPITMEPNHKKGDDVPAWLLDQDYNGLVFQVSQAFFPRTGAWDNLRKALRVSHADTVWDHLAGTVSAPFEVGEHRAIAVKVIDDRGNELMTIKQLPLSK